MPNRCLSAQRSLTSIMVPLFALIALSAGRPALVAADVLQVTKTADTNDGSCDPLDCSLREAITQAEPGDEVMFQPIFRTAQTITLAGEALVIDKGLTISGPGANRLTVSADHQSGVFIIPTSGVSVHLKGMTITDGNSEQFGGVLNVGELTIEECHITGNRGDLGGGIANFAGGSLTLRRSTISANSATQNLQNPAAGGIFSNLGGSLLIIGSTISGNTSFGESSQNSGGISASDSTMLIADSTITNNAATGTSSSGGIHTTRGSTTLINTIVASNYLLVQGENSSVTIHDLFAGAGTISSAGYNLIGNPGEVSFALPSDQVGTQTRALDPLLAPLEYNGGTTPTHALLASSPALDRGLGINGPQDQRGFSRPFDQPGVPNADGGNGADIGAVEQHATWQVTLTADTDDGMCNAQCSLREAIQAAGDGDEITFSPLFDSPQVITLNGAQLTIGNGIRIIGPGADRLTVSGNRTSRVFEVAADATVELRGMTIADGRTADSGGGILNHGRLTVTECHVTDNAARDAGGIHNDLRGGGLGDLTLIRSTVSNNTAGFVAAGINSAFGIALSVINSTISGNVATGNGEGGLRAGPASVISSTITNNTGAGADRAGGVFGESIATITCRNSIIAGNIGVDVFHEQDRFLSAGYNLIGDKGLVSAFDAVGDQVGTMASPLSPEIGPLQNNGGTTPTHALLTTSPAVDKGHSSGLNTDQRGYGRPFDFEEIGPGTGGDDADIGAFELLGQPPVNTTPTPMATPTPTATATQVVVPTGGPCCSAHDGAGCQIAACEACVCGALSRCCDEPWDQECVSVTRECESVCLCNATPAPTSTPTPTSEPSSCVGDCDGSNAVTVDEIVVGVNIALGSTSIDACSAFDPSEDRAVTVDELLKGVSNALVGCS